MARERSADDDPDPLTVAEWRAQRPLAGAVLLVVGGLVIAWPSLEFVVRTSVIQTRSVVSLGIVVGAAISFAGVAALVRPGYSTHVGVVGLVLSAASFVIAFGGFIVGMLLSSAGAILCFAWAPPDATPDDADEE